MYKKEFTRDFSIIMEEAWHYSIFLGTEKVLGFKFLGKSPLVFYYLDSSIEVWSDEVALNGFMERLDQYSRKNPEIMKAVLNAYKRKLKNFSPFFRQKRAGNNKKLIFFINLLFDIISYFTIMYYIADHSLASPAVRKIAEEIRLKDSFYDDVDNYIRQSLKKIHPSLGGLETAILKDEIMVFPSKKELLKRQKGFILIPGEYFFLGSLESFARRYKNYVFNFLKYNPKKKIIKGTPAFSGQAKGRVMIIKNKEKIKLFKKGYILVSPMTTPDYLPAMKKAKAFITDEGGMLCHAAIVARELKKPCIIGTKIATKVLHDGDFVEVDAEKGIVKIIKSK